MQFLHSLKRLWSERKRRVIIKSVDLSNDIIVEILSRLPADEVLKCRRVCKTWRNLTSTPHFVELHLQHSLPMLLVHYDQLLGDSAKTESFFLDKNAKMKRVCARSSRMHKIQRIAQRLAGSCNGLLLFKPVEDNYSSSVFFVCNPSTDEVVMLDKPLMEGYLIGFFFHSSTKEYRILYVHRNQYFILTLGKANRWRSLGTFAYIPHSSDSSSFPVLISKTLHWMVEYNGYENEIDMPSCENSIMLFNMDTEDFSTLPHPGSQCFSRSRHKSMQLLEMNGKLSFWCVYFESIHVWVLTDCDSWDWTKTFKINLDPIVKRYRFYGDVFDDEYDISFVNIQGNELLLVWSNRGVFRYNLETKMIKKINLARIREHRISYEFSFTSYTKSLVSLRCLYDYNQNLEKWKILL